VIAEAIDAADSVIRALLVWIVLAAAVLTAALFAVVVAGWAVWRTTVAAVKAARAWLSWRPAAEVPPHAPPEDAPAPGVAQARTRPAPAWARTDKEAA
jgi:hypothetical protein